MSSLKEILGSFRRGPRPPNMSAMRFIPHEISNATGRMDIACKVCVQELRLSGVRRLRGGARSRTLEGSSFKTLQGFLLFLIRKPQAGTAVSSQMKLRKTLRGADRFQQAL